jgi:hypothetical protein
MVFKTFLCNAYNNCLVSKLLAASYMPSRRWSNQIHILLKAKDLPLWKWVIRDLLVV